MNTKFIQLNKYYFICEVSNFKYIKIYENENIVKFEAVAQKSIPFKTIYNRGIYKNGIETKKTRGNFKNQIVTKFKKDILFLN